MWTKYSPPSQGTLHVPFVGKFDPLVQELSFKRTPIQSKAVNQSLKDLIDQFAAQKKKVETAKGGDLDDIFESANHKRSANEEEEMEHAMKEASRYMAKMKSCEAR